MKFSVACNFDDALLEGLRGYPVYEIYGKLTSDFFGGGRPSFYLPEVDRAGLAAYVRKTHDAGIGFNYLLNASAMGNTEFTREGQRNMEEILEWLDAIGVDSVTVLSDPLDRFPISLRHVEPPSFIDHCADAHFVGHFGRSQVFCRA